MCAAIPIIMGVVTAGLGIGQAVVGAQAAQQQVAFANAQAQQAYSFQQMQAGAASNFEQLKAGQQEGLMQVNRLMADNSYSDEIAALNARLMQETAAASQEAQKGAIAGTKARGEIIASGRLGNTVDNLVADFRRQQAQFDYATSQNLAFTGQQIQLEKRGAAAQRGSRIASQQAYIKQPVLDPQEPIYQAKPSMLPFILQGAGAVVSGISTGISTQASLDKIKTGRPPPVPRATPSSASAAGFGGGFNSGIQPITAADYSGRFKR
jgi:hypothetical protein